MAFFGKSFSPKPAQEKSPQFSKPAPSPKPSQILRGKTWEGKPAPEKPKSFFEQKSHWARSDFKREAAKDSLSIGGRAVGHHERKKIMDELFPSSRFGTHISRDDTTRRLRELNKEASLGKTYQERQRAATLKQYLKKRTGL